MKCNRQAEACNFIAAFVKIDSASSGILYLCIFLSSVKQIPILDVFIWSKLSFSISFPIIFRKILVVKLAA